MSDRIALDRFPIAFLKPRIKRPYAWVGHIPFAYVLMELLKPRRVVELGTDSGNSYLAICQAVAHLKLQTQCTAVDCWRGDEHAGSYGEDVYRTLRAYHDPRYGQFSNLMRAWFDEAVGEFEDGSIDLLHIDGLHTYEAVRNDFETWRSKLSDRAVVLFHDSAIVDRGFGVHRYIEELSAEFKIFSFDHSNGLSVARVGNDPGESVESFFALAENDPERVKRYFEAVASTLFDEVSAAGEGGESQEPNIVAKLYYRDHDEGFDEARVESFPLRVDAAHEDARCFFELGPHIRPSIVRFDPASVPGVYVLKRIALEFEKGLSVFSIDFSNAALLSINKTSELTERADGMRLVCFDDDPWFELDISDAWKRFPESAAVVICFDVLFEAVLFDPKLQTAAKIQRDAYLDLVGRIDISAKVTSLDRKISKSMTDSASEFHATLDRNHKEMAAMLEALAARVTSCENATEKNTGDTRKNADEIKRNTDETRRYTDEIKRNTDEVKRNADEVKRNADEVKRNADEIKSNSDRIEQVTSELRAYIASFDEERSANNIWREHFDAESQRILSILSRPAWYRRLARRTLAFFRRGARVNIRAGKVTLRPLANIAVKESSEETCVWASSSDDPQCEVIPGNAKALRMSKGWYALSIEIENVDGLAASPMLYPDYGYGYREDLRISLPEYNEQGRLDVLILLKEDAHALRFDPSASAVAFRAKRFEMRRVGRIRAAMIMAKTVANARSDKKVFFAYAHQLSAMCKNAVAYRLRSAGDIAYKEYAAVVFTNDRDYQAWIRTHDLPQQASSDAMRARENALQIKPKLSILVPVYNTKERWLRACIESVISQAYQNWELCIADDASTSPHVRKVLEEYARRDNRIKVCFRETNGHISAASNSALELASGDYCALLDHDDLLPKHALLEVAEVIANRPDVRIIYSDEDKIDEQGNRYDPYFKPDWNYDLFLSQNCISHLGVYSSSLLRDVGGFQNGKEGSQDWDLALRCVERVEGKQIFHIAKVLYHWRAIPGSTALGVGEKSYAHTAAFAAIRSHLERRGGVARVEEIAGQQGRFRVRYALPETAPLVSLIIPTKDKVDLLKCCIDSIIELTTYKNFEILVVDNGSIEKNSHRYFEEIANDSRIRVLPYPAPFNYSAINNYAAARASGSVLGFVNNDIEVISPDWLDEMVSQCLRQEIGAVGAKLYYPNDTIQHAGVVLGLGGIAGHVYAGLPKDYPGQMGRALLVQEMSAVTAACMLVRRDVFNSVDGFDEALRVAFNDVDLCLRIKRAGYRNLWTPFAELYHHESASRGYEDTPEKMKRFQGEIDLMRKRWGDLLPADPAYSINLPLVNDGSLFAFPPRQIG